MKPAYPSTARRDRIAFRRLLAAVALAAVAFPPPLAATEPSTRDGLFFSVPVIEQVVPPTVAAGTRSLRVRLVGHDFAADALLTSHSPEVTIESYRVVSSRLVEAVVSVPRDAALGPYSLILSNRGVEATAFTRLVVVAAGSPAAPLSVTSLVVVSPRPGAHMAEGEDFYAHGVLAVVGSGAISGGWELDGQLFDRFVLAAVGSRPLTVRSRLPIPQLFRGEHRLRLVTDDPGSLASPAVPIVQTMRRASQLTLLSPEPGAAVAAGDSPFRWSLVPGAAGYEVELEDSTREVWRRRTAEPSCLPTTAERGALAAGSCRWRVRPVYAAEARGEPTAWRECVLLAETGATEAAAAASASGPRRVALLQRAQESPWRFALDEPGAEAAPPAEAPPAAPSAWAISAEGTLTGFGGDDPQPPAVARLLGSGRLDLERLQATADASASWQLEDPGDAAQETESWLLDARTRPWNATSGSLVVGYGSPRFLDPRLEYTTTAGMTRGGVEANLDRAGFRLSLYQSFDPAIGDVAAGNLGFDQDFRAAALELGGGERPYLLRAVATDVDTAGDSFTPPSSGANLGLFGSWSRGPAAAFLLEVARGELDEATGTRNGSAYRAGAAGTLAGVVYDLNLRHTAKDFVNPANPGLTPGSFSGIDQLDLSLSRNFTASNLALALQRLEGSAAAGARATSASLSYGLRPTSSQDYSVAVNATTTAAPGDAQNAIPATELLDWGVALAGNQTLRGLRVGETLSRQVHADDVTPLSDGTTTSAGLTLSGALGEPAAINAAVLASRIGADPLFGDTDNLTASLQPTLTLARAWLSIAPLLAYNRSRNDTTGLDSATRQLQLRSLWNPPWWSSLLSLDATGDWSRFDNAGSAATETLTLSLVATLRWGRRGGFAALPSGVPQASTAALFAQPPEPPTGDRARRSRR